jgi:hypothetical protein
MLKMVEIKLIAPRIEEAPLTCNEKIARSTAPPLWKAAVESGG